MAQQPSTTRRMPLAEALEVLARQRSDEIVVTTMGSAREWPKLSEHPLDFHYLPSAMGHAPMLALGLALAQPQREVICFNGDGCMLMGLAALVTMAASGAKNLTLIVLENGIYEVTGGQATAGSRVNVDFAGFARAAGLPTVLDFDCVDAWREAATGLLKLPGPRFVVLHVEAVGPAYQLPTPEPMSARISRFRETLGTT